jgi:hypothetical protein
MIEICTRVVCAVANKQASEAYHMDEPYDLGAGQVSPLSSELSGRANRLLALTEFRDPCLLALASN